MPAGEGLEAGLPVMERLALSYAPRAARLPWLALLALDARLAAIVRAAREPMLAQLRLAWWRDALGQPAFAWPAGEPVLAALVSWQGAHSPLAALAEAWGGMTGDAPLGVAAFGELAEARGEAFALLADTLGAEAARGDARRMARCVAISDLAGRVTHPQERACLASTMAGQDWRAARLPRSLRPLAVLHGLAARKRTAPVDAAPGPGALLTAMRLGLLGR